MRFAGLIANKITGLLHKPTADGTITGYNNRVYDPDKYGDKYLGDPIRGNSKWIDEEAIQVQQSPQPIRPGSKGIYY